MPKPEEYSERTLQVLGWSLRVVTYRLGRSEEHTSELQSQR